jgi:hypothetical protein
LTRAHQTRPPTHTRVRPPRSNGTAAKTDGRTPTRWHERARARALLAQPPRDDPRRSARSQPLQLEESWINQIERWFAYLTEDLLRRSDHRNVHALENDIRRWVKARNENPRPFVWSKPAEEILASLQRLL